MATNFYLDKRTDKKGDAPIRVSINILGVRYLTSTPYKINPAKWDASKQQARKGTSNASGLMWSAINSGLARIAEYFAAYESKCIAEKSHLDKRTLQVEYKSNFARCKSPAAKEAKTLFGYLDEFTTDKGSASGWSISTYKKFETLKSHLRGFNPELSFNALGEIGLTAFIAYLRDAKQLRNSTIGKLYNLLKWFLKWATLKGYNTNLEFQSFTPKLKTTARKVIFLDKKELMTVYNYDIPANGTEVKLTTNDGTEYTKVMRDASAISKTRDIFCFCCFTSLRYSDAANLKRADIDGDTMIITTVKTSDTIRIKLNKYALAILAKYENSPNIGGYVFPPITNQRMNIYLKDLCELCGINQPITQTYFRGSERIEETTPKYALIGTHTGRRTFICNALALGISPQVVMKFTGHSDYKSMKPYIDVTEAAQAEAMARFDTLF